MSLIILLYRMLSQAWDVVVQKALTGLTIMLVVGCAGSPAPQQHETMLLVSLRDGTVIQQTVQLDADICFKTNGIPTTTCLTRGDPIFAQPDGRVIGYEMSSKQIELMPK